MITAGIIKESAISQGGARKNHRHARNWAFYLAAATFLAAAVSVAADTRKDLHFNLSPGSTVDIVNQNGSITVHPSNGRQLLVTATLKSDNVEVDSNQNGNRVTLRTHVLRKDGEARVDYDISLPSDSSVNIDSEDGPIRVENVQGNVSVESDAGNVDLTGIRGGVQVQTVNAAIGLKDIKGGLVSITTTGGNVQMTGVTGSRVTVETTTGNIGYDGDFAGGGTYTLMNHTGDIEVKVPAEASVELTARSVKGTVSNDFPFQKASHPGFQLSEGRSFAGTSHSGASSVELRSFSGKIRVSKQ